MRMLNIGYGNYVNPHGVDGIMEINSNASEALLRQYRERSELIDCTDDKEAKTIITTKNFAYLSRLSAESLKERFVRCTF